nr:MAG TPA: hypothetical protein [Caudoviricetes sp.]
MLFGSICSLSICNMIKTANIIIISYHRKMILDRLDYYVN